MMTIMETLRSELDGPDLQSVDEALELRAEWTLPAKSTSSRTGAALAEICRVWVEFVHDAEKAEKAAHDDLARVFGSNNGGLL